MHSVCKHILFLQRMSIYISQFQLKFAVRTLLLGSKLASVTAFLFSAVSGTGGKSGITPLQRK